MRSNLYFEVIPEVKNSKNVKLEVKVKLFLAFV